MQHTLNANDQVLLADGSYARASAVAFMLTKIRTFITATPTNLPAFVWMVDAAMTHGEQEFRTQNMHASVVAEAGFGEMHAVVGAVKVKLFPSFVRIMTHICHYNTTFMRDVIELMLTYAQVGVVTEVADETLAVCESIIAERHDRAAEILRARLPFDQAMLALWLTLNIPLHVTVAARPLSQRFESHG